MRSKILAGVVLLAGLLAPSAGRAADPLGGVCMADGIKAVDETCTTSFDYPEGAGSYRVSLLYSGGDYRPITLDADNQPVGGGAGTRGTVEVTWLDADGVLIYTLSCPTLAFQADYQATSVTRAHCTETRTLATPAPGAQTLRVRAVALDGAPAKGIRMQGRLTLTPVDQPV